MRTIEYYIEKCEWLRRETDEQIALHIQREKQLEARIAELAEQLDIGPCVACQRERDIAEEGRAALEARLDALELKTAQPWEEDWERGYVCGWNECRKAALEQK